VARVKTLAAQEGLQPVDLREEVFERRRRRCVYCGATEALQVNSAATREKMSKSHSRRAAMKRAAAEHARDEKVRKRLFEDAEDKVYRDALEYLLAHQLEPAEALREIVGDPRHPDRMRAEGEWLDRTHGNPVQVQRTVGLTGQLSREEIAQLLAPTAPLLGLEAPSTAADTP
jgi:hypothetical protein